MVYVYIHIYNIYYTLLLLLYTIWHIIITYIYYIQEGKQQPQQQQPEPTCNQSRRGRKEIENTTRYQLKANRAASGKPKLLQKLQTNCRAKGKHKTKAKAQSKRNLGNFSR